MANWGLALAKGLGMAINTENTNYAERLKEHRVIAKTKYAKQTAADEADFAEQTAYHGRVKQHLGQKDKATGKYTVKNHQALAREILTKQARGAGVPDTALYDTVTDMMKEQEGKELSLDFLKATPKKKVYDASGWKEHMATVKAGPLSSSLSGGIKSGINTLFGSDSKEPDSGMATQGTTQGAIQGVGQVEATAQENFGVVKPEVTSDKDLKFSGARSKVSITGADGKQKVVLAREADDGFRYYTGADGLVQVTDKDKDVDEAVPITGGNVRDFLINGKIVTVDLRGAMPVILGTKTGVDMSDAREVAPLTAKPTWGESETFANVDDPNEKEIRGTRKDDGHYYARSVDEEGVATDRLLGENYVAVTHTSDKKPGHRTGLNAQVKITRSFVSSTLRTASLTANVIKVLGNNPDATADGAVFVAKAFTGVAHEITAAVNLVKGGISPELSKTLSGFSQAALDDPKHKVWDNLPEAIASNNILKGTLVDLAFMELAASGQTGAQVSAKEFDAKLKSLAAGMSSPETGLIVMRNLQAKLHTRVDDHWAAFPADYREDLERNYSIEELKGNLDTKAGGAPDPEGEPKPKVKTPDEIRAEKVRALYQGVDRMTTRERMIWLANPNNAIMLPGYKKHVTERDANR
jgi:hypothetical protein